MEYCVFKICKTGINYPTISMEFSVSQRKIAWAVKLSLFQQKYYEGRSSAMKYGILYILPLKSWGQFSHMEYDISVIHKKKKIVSEFYT